MITLAWWLFLPLLLLAIGGCLLGAAAVSVSREDRTHRESRRRAVYVDWCRRNYWCPEHNIPDGHSTIRPGDDGLLTVLPCPGSTTRHAVPAGSVARDMVRRERQELEQLARNDLR